MRLARIFRIRHPKSRPEAFPGMLAAAGFLVIVLSVAAGPPLLRGEDLIAGIGLTQLTVYDQRPAPDGLNSGSPHIHAVTDEGYYVISGRGRVELHDLRHGFQTVELTPGSYLQYPPGVLHRLVSTDHLVLLVVMGNAGLAEYGDARIYFGKKVDENPAEFARLVGLAAAEGLEGALKRRDAAVRAYLGLLDLWHKDRAAYFAELKRFIDVHMKAAAELRADFSKAVEAGPVAWGEKFRRRVADLPLSREGLAPLLYVPTEQTTLGMCGILKPVMKLESVGGREEAGPKK
jgi:mannose-6-phosphate isomerase-like protein (cupin superfamily)